MESRKSQPLNNKNNDENDENDLPTESEIYRVQKIKNDKNKQLIGNINFNQDDEKDFNDDTDENIIINQPNNYNSLKINNLNIHNPNNINSITFHNQQNNNNRNNNNNINSLISNNINNNIMESFLDENGDVVYKNYEPELSRIDSHRIKVGNNEFEDLTTEAREMQNKEAFEKKILGIYNNNNIEREREIIQENKPFLERIGDFIDNHQEGILAVIDGIGCILLHGPSIARTINRLDRWIDNIGSNNSEQNQNNEQNILNEIGLQEKEKDLNTILKFLPIWEVRENKRHDNNNNCVVCLSEFQIGDIISALPCCHVFHTECVKNWLKNELSCPVCKFEVTLSSIIGKNNN